MVRWTLLDTLAFLLLLSLLLPSLLIMFIPSTFKRPVSSWKALNLRKTLLMASSVRLKPLNCCTNLASHFFDLVIGKILTSRLSLSKHLAHNLGNLLLLGKIGVFHNRRNASSRLLLLISKHLILCIYLVFRILA